MNHKEYAEQTNRTDVDYEKVFQRISEGRDACRWNGFVRLDGEIVSYSNPLELLHGLLGMVTELGELVDVYKKWLFYGKPMDVTNLAEEMGDMEWYETRVLNYLRVELDKIWEKNISKLQVRYPEKFDEEKALNRNLESERKELEK